MVLNGAPTATYVVTANSYSKQERGCTVLGLRGLLFPWFVFQVSSV
jgi:hypothetical protein